MHTVNHAAAGAGIALAVRQPLLALPLALASHFVLDALPHYGKKPPKAGPITRFHKRFQWRERDGGVFIEIPVASILLLAIWRLQ
ncbi:MAG: hypothetical protein WAQ57_04090 [Candidatus Saccharimonadales bacterium]